ncbi:hypothetical protein V6N12_012783 [Hibiscus sabdariffa]|uniref:Uncharacterized protein n=1 Tax=Hibiscus sabdariffa TaxID=183260 RepID=A0ABR2EFD5_9ROSI
MPFSRDWRGNQSVSLAPPPSRRAWMSQPPSSTSPFRYEHNPTSRTSSSAIMCSETGPEPLSAPFVLITPPPPPSPR